MENKNGERFRKLALMAISVISVFLAVWLFFGAYYLESMGRIQWGAYSGMERIGGFLGIISGFLGTLIFLRPSSGVALLITALAIMLVTGQATYWTEIGQMVVPGNYLVRLPKGEQKMVVEKIHSEGKPITVKKLWGIHKKFEREETDSAKSLKQLNDMESSVTLGSTPAVHPVKLQ